MSDSSARPAEMPLGQYLAALAQEVGQTLRGNSQAMWLTGLYLGIPVGIVQLIATGVLIRSGGVAVLEADRVARASESEVLRAAAGLLLLAAVSWASTSVVQFLANVIIARQIGQKRAADPQLSQSLADPPSMVGKLSLTLALTGLIVGVPLALCAPGAVLLASGMQATGWTTLLLGVALGGCASLWLWIRYALSPAAMSWEGLGVREALSRSARLTSLQLPRTATVLLAGALAGQICGAAVALPLSLFGGVETTAGVFFLTSATIVSTAVTLPIVAAVATLRFAHLRALVDEQQDPDGTGQVVDHMSDDRGSS